MNTQSGNVLFLILIAVALFAALSYAVTSSTRSGGADASNEKADLQATRLINYAASFNMAIQRVNISNGCDVSDINPDVMTGNPANFPGLCNLYDKTGGGVIYQMIKNGDPTVYSTSTNAPYPGKVLWIFNSMAVQNIGSPIPEITLFMFNIKPEICKAIDRKLDIGQAGGEPPLEDTPYEGGWYQPHPNPSGDALIIGRNLGGITNALEGHDMGCYRASRSGSDMGYHFYSVMKSY